MSLRKLLDSSKANFFSLILIQGANSIVPVIVFPYAYSILGESTFYKIALSESISAVLVSLVLFSFEVQGVNKIVAQEDGVFFSIFFSRLFIFLCSVVFLCPLVYFLFESVFYSVLSWLLFPLSYIFYSSYYFIAKGNNVFHALVVVSSRLSSLALVFFFLKKESTAIDFSLLLLAPYFFGSLICFAYIISHFHEHFILPKFNHIKRYIFNGAFVFWGNLSVSLYRDFNVFYLGVLSLPPGVIAIYAILEKWIKCLQAIVRPINQYYYTDLVSNLRMYDKPESSVYLMLKEKSSIQLVLTYGILIFAYLIAIAFYLYFQEGSFSPVGLPEFISFIIMAITIIFGVKNFIFGVVGLNSLNRDKEMAFSVTKAGLFHVMFFFFSAYVFGLIGAAIAFLLSEVFLFLLIKLQYGQRNGI
ncbi:hypothetical protein DDN04_16275 [Vibrio cholerae]|nr:hypothetical protein [Vibrio cholerae]